MKTTFSSRKTSRKHLHGADRAFTIFKLLFWITVMIIILYPLYLIIIASVSDPDAVLRGEVIFHPVGFSLIGYQAVFQYREMMNAYLNSFIYTLSGITLSIFITLAAAYTLSRQNFPGKKTLNFFFILTMFFNGGLIPTFLVIRDIGLYNNRLLMVLMGCVSVWNLMVARTYIQNSIPNELYEAATLDGANHFTYFFRIILPLSKTIIAVLAVYYGVSKWNDYFTGLVYIRDRIKLPLQTILREVLASLQVDKSGDYMSSVADNAASMAEAMRIANVAKYCIIVVATGPVVLLYAFMQKHFEKGVMIGSLKG